MLQEITKDKSYFKMLLAMLLTNFTGIYYCIIFTPLGYVYNDFPGQEALINLMVVLPGLAAMAGGFAAAGLLDRIGNKALVVFSLSLTLIGSMMARFLGHGSLMIAVIGVALTGFSSGLVPAAVHAAMGAVSPEYFRDKVVGWGEVASSLGFIIFNMIAAFASAANADWAAAYNAGFLLIPIILVAILWYPSTATIRQREAAAAAEAAGVTDEESAAGIIDYMPKCILALVAFKFVQAMFYMGLNVLSSDYIINEIQAGSSALVGMTYNVNSAISLLFGMIVFVWLRKFKGASTLIAGIEMGLSCLVVVLVPNAMGFFVGFCLQGIGMVANHAGMGTVSSMAPKGKAIAVASGLFMAATYVGEALDIYVCPFLSRIILHNTNPSGGILIAAFGSIIFGILSYPFFKKAYYEAFPEKEA